MFERQPCRVQWARTRDPRLLGTESSPAPLIDHFTPPRSLCFTCETAEQTSVSLLVSHLHSLKRDDMLNDALCFQRLLRYTFNMSSFVSADSSSDLYDSSPSAQGCGRLVHHRRSHPAFLSPLLLPQMKGPVFPFSLPISEYLWKIPESVGFMNSQ